MSFEVRSPFHRFVSARTRQWKEKTGLLVLLVISAALQGALSSGLGFANFRPSLILIVVIFWSLKRGMLEGIVWGLIGGGLEDVFSAGMLGLGSVTLAATGGLTALACRPLYRDHLSTKISMVAGASLFNAHLYYLFLALFRQPPAWIWVMREVVWPGLWQTVLVAPLWLWVAGKVLKD